MLFQPLVVFFLLLVESLFSIPFKVRVVDFVLQFFLDILCISDLEKIHDPINAAARVNPYQKPSPKFLRRRRGAAFFAKAKPCRREEKGALGGATIEARVNELTADLSPQRRPARSP
jgi:hypothetical protein